MLNFAEQTGSGAVMLVWSFPLYHRTGHPTIPDTTSTANVHPSQIIFSPNYLTANHNGSAPTVLLQRQSPCSLLWILPLQISPPKTANDAEIYTAS
jgi:hypothetical protein